MKVRQPFVGEADERDGALVDVAAVAPAGARGHRHHLRGLGGEQVADGVDRVHPEVVHGPAAEAALEPDVVLALEPGRDVRAERLRLPDVPAPHEFDRGERGRLEAEPVRDHQLHAVRLARADHPAALVGGDGHGPFAEHVGAPRAASTV